MKKMILSLCLAFLLAGLTGCATVKPQVVRWCQDQRCDTLGEDRATKEALLVKMAQFLKANLNRDIALYETGSADEFRPEKGPKGYARGISWYVQGGPMPGLAVTKTIKFTDIVYMDRENLEIKFKVKPLDCTWIGTPVFQAEAEGTISIRSAREIQYSATYFGSWLIAAGAWKHEWLIDYIDFDRGILGGNFSVAGGGLMNLGGGKGYQMVLGGVETLRQTGATTTIKEPQKMLHPNLVYQVRFTESSGDGVVEGGEDISLKVEVENRGKGAAKDVHVLLSGHPGLLGFLGDRRSLGDILPGEKKIAEFKASLPIELARETADLKIEVGEGSGFSAPEVKTLKIAMKPGKSIVKETVEVISQLPQLAFSTQLKDQNGNRILESGEEVTLRVSIENSGEGAARDVQLVLSGSPYLVSLFGEKRLIGNIAPGERKTVEFKGVLPARIPTETASLRIALMEGKGFSPAAAKTLLVAVRALEVKETLEVISEVNVDDIPLKVRDYEKKENVALVIGISKYREKMIPEVKYAARDAEVVARYLENVGGIPRANIKVLTDDKATKSDIEAHISDWIPRRTTADSTVFIYYAGHGAPGPQGRDAYVVPYEGRPDYPSQLYPLQKMYDALNRLPAREVVVMLDSCFSGAKGRSVTGEGTRPVSISIEDPLLAGGKIMVIAASTGGQMSSDYDKVRHGLFTYYLLRGMRGEASKDKEGIVYLGGLYEFLKKNVSETASLEMNRDQTPVLFPSEFVVRNKLKVPISRAR
ncbi:MAG: caspase family protein [Syntrophales bacterium]